MTKIKEIVGQVIASFLSKRGFALVPLEEIKLRAREKQNFASLCEAYQVLQSCAGHDLAPSFSAARQAELISRQLGTPPAEAYLILSALWKTKEIGGDVCEFGVAQGELSALIAEEIKPTAKRLHLFDTFEGLPCPGKEDELKDDVFGLSSIEAYTGQMAFPDLCVRERLRAVGFPRERCTLHKGLFANLLAKKLGFPTKVSFAYVDFDFYDPILQALEFLHTVTDSGAVIIVDDYDYFSTGAKKAVDSFLAEKNSQHQAYNMQVADARLAHCAIITRR